MKKLVGALTTYFIRSTHRWQHPILHLALSIQQGDAFPLEHLPQAQGALTQVLPALTPSQHILLLWLSSNLATDCKKIDGNQPAHLEMHKQLEVVVQSAGELMAFVLDQPASSSSPDSIRAKAECLAGFLHWVNYGQPRWSTNLEALRVLQNLVGKLAPLLAEDALFNDASEVFRDILESSASFFLPKDMEALAYSISHQVRPRLLEGLTNQDPAVVHVAQLVIAYGTAVVEHLVQKPEDPHFREILELQFAIIDAPGYPGDDDEVSIMGIEFWNAYIEYVNDESYSQSEEGGHPAWLPYSKNVCARLVTILLNKMTTPSSDVAADWGSEEEDGFRDFRMDASDLLLSVFVQLGDDMGQLFTSKILQALADRNWRDSEAVMYCLNKLSDNLMDLRDGDALLAQIFGSELFRLVADFSQPILPQARKAAIDLLGAYDEYIRQHAEFLPDTLRFLFASLETPDFVASAARSISELCSTCRNSLTGELEGFINHYNNFARGPTSDAYANEKVMGAIAAVIEALAPENAKVAPLSALLDIIEEMIRSATTAAANANHDAAHEIALSTLKCLTSSGKGLQAPEDGAIDLTGDEGGDDSQSNFWNTPEGQSIQFRILNCCYTILQLLPASGEIIDGFCQVLKTGFPETKPGPFVFSPIVIVEFIERCSLQTPQLETVLSIASTFIVQSRARRDKANVTPLIDRVYRHTVTLIRNLAQPSRDPAVAQTCLDVFVRMSDGFAPVLLDTTSADGAQLQAILDFALLALAGPDLMPKRAAADFWAKFVRLAGPSSTEPVVRDRAAQALAAYGPPLAQRLIVQITGQAMRSELDQLCAPLGALVQTQPQAKSWLEAALFDPALAQTLHPAVDEAQKRRFVQSVLRLRGGGRETKELVRSFYAACRGTVESFSS